MKKQKKMKENEKKDQKIKSKKNTIGKNSSNNKIVECAHLSED